MGVAAAIDITVEQRSLLLELFHRHLPGTAAWAYGSRVKWTSSPKSDLDLVVFAGSAQSRQVGDLREALEESDLPFRVDLFVWDEVPESFKEAISEEHAVLTENPQNRWNEVALGDCARLNESTYSLSESWSFINYLDTGNITDNQVSEYQHLIPGIDKVPSRARRKVQDGDIVYSTVRPNKKHFGILKKIPENCLVSTGFAVIRGKEKIAETEYVYRFLTQNKVVEHLHTIAEHSTSAYPSIRPSDIESLRLRLPPLPEQRAIARVLGTLDDRIELNRRMCRTLEEMARALFKSWFVDFEPVRAKMAGKDPGLPRHLADLFPDRLVDSELGKIPQGWEIKNLGDFADSPKRSINPADLPFNTPYIGLEHMPRGSITLTKWQDAGKATSSKSVFHQGDFLFGKLRPYFHKVGLAPLDGICSTDIVVVIPRNPDWAAFTLACLSSIKFIRYADRTSTGTRMPRTSWSAMLAFKVPLPPIDVAIEFQQLMQPLLDRLIANVHACQMLTQIRNALIDKLISGDVQLTNATSHDKKSSCRK